MSKSIPENRIPQYEQLPFYQPSFTNFPAQVDRIWCILNCAQARASMLAMTERGLPAVNELHKVADFREIIEDEPVSMDDNFRQLTGQLCGQVMSLLGYESFRRSDTRESPIFSKGEVYRERNL